MISDVWVISYGDLGEYLLDIECEGMGFRRSITRVTKAPLLECAKFATLQQAEELARSVIKAGLAKGLQVIHYQVAHSFIESWIVGSHEPLYSFPTARQPTTPLND